MKRRIYKKNPEWIKEAVIRTQGEAFKDSIPRNTVKYWLTNSKKPRPRQVRFNRSKESIYYKSQWDKERIRVFILKEKIKYYSLLCRSKKLSSSTKQEIIRSINIAKAFLGLKETLFLMDMTRSTYHRWSQPQACLVSKSNCVIRHPQQLTREEIQIIKDLCARRKFKHFSLTALHKYAVKNQLLSCSKETWFKYIHRFNLVRRPSRRKKKSYRKGIRASAPNQIWHMDITQITTSAGEKVYLQVIIDNYSRKVLAWTMASVKDQHVTIHTLKQLGQKLRCKHVKLFTDQGGENRGAAIKWGPHIKRVFARVESQYSNSVVEMFFRSLKHNFLYRLNLRSFEYTKRKVAYYIKQHNSIMPHSQFRLATPNEVFRGVTDRMIEEQVNYLHSREKRMSLNRTTTSCPNCIKKPLVNQRLFKVVEVVGQHLPRFSSRAGLFLHLKERLRWDAFMGFPPS